ncbi:FMN-dependent NADH-azoreductase [Arenibaculum sp.]|uniref:FMN-dependent NADH-azoreductase n=1 Tax=Arenibaculum sp. TaxID=2865862 RepID=UPI002E124B37|nr:FMN-dependent NADH-azoreductase [Arenibaculum sp.]
MKLLHLDSSPLGDASASRALTAAAVDAWRRAEPAVEVVRRDLAAAPPGHLTGDLLKVVRSRETDGLNEEQRRELALTDALLDEFLAADAVVIGAPMQNFSIPTQLKAWMDRIAQAGRTFRYTEQGPVGLAGGKQVVIVSTRGGFYAGQPHEAALDHQEAYLRAFLGFLGITDVSVVRAEGLNIGPEARSQAMEAAQTEIEGMFRSSPGATAAA